MNPRDLLTHILLLLLLPLLAVAIRLGLIAQIQCINGDGIIFIEIARQLLDHSFHEVAMVNRQHLLYPWFVMSTFRILQDWEWSGRLIALAFGSATVIPLYLFSYQLFRSKNIAFWSGLIYAVSPYFVRNHAQVFSEGVFHFFFFWSVYFGWFVAARDHVPAAVMCGLSAALAYLTRPEGIGVLLVVAAFLGGRIIVQILLFHRLRGGHWVRIPIRLGLMIILLVTFLIPSLSYLSSLHESSGRWSLSQKKQLSSMFTTKLGDYTRDQNIENSIRRDEKKYYYQKEPQFKYVGQGQKALLSFWEVLRELFQASFPPFFLLAVSGLLWRPSIRRHRLGEAYLLATVLLYLLVYFQLMYHEGYLVKRHMLTVSILLCIWAGVGLEELSRWFGSKQRLSRFWKVNVGADTAFGFKVVVVLLLVLITMPKNLKALHRSEVVCKHAGLWLAEQYGSEITLLTNKDEIGFYSRADYRRLQPALPEGVAEQLQQVGARIFAMETSKDFAGFIKNKKWQEISALRLIKTFQYQDKSVLIFEYLQ